MDFIESIGPVLGIVAFVGLAALAFLLFQQARDLRRLREWAGRAPERAQEAADAVQAAGEASRTDADAEVAEAPAPGGLGAAWARFRGATTSRWAELERRLPVDGRYVLAVVVGAVIVVGVLTSGFGLVGDEDGKGHRHGGGSPKPTVAILNGTGVPGLAAQVDKEVVRAAGYKTGPIDNAGSTVTSTVAMFAPGHEADAKRLAKAVEAQLGKTPTQAMTSDISSLAGSAKLALALGVDDSQFGSGSG
ncbi:MAG TPA: LytR C-terminal domain-containing protein [Solirubrobacterales bacterium]|nr:LytR C-terminal domain-containing protein [Solirubrobacterales bacterium]